MQTSTVNLPLSVNQTPSATAASESEAHSGVTRLTHGLAQGNEEAFREFHRLYFDRLYQFLLVVSRGHEHEAQEALQETFLRVARYAREFQNEEVFWSWLKAVARSAARDAGRKRRRYLDFLERFAFHAHLLVADESSREEEALRATLEEGLLELEPADRRLIEGKYLEGSRVRDLALSEGLTEKAVESRLLRARRTIRECILSKLKKS